MADWTRLSHPRAILSERLDARRDCAAFWRARDGDCPARRPQRTVTATVCTRLLPMP